MDWYSWLSRTNLEPSLIYEYTIFFSNNELEYEDIAYFNHEFLQSMGISIAKHRLEILKLARKEKKPSPSSISKVLNVIKKTKKCFSEYVKAWIRKEESSRALVAFPSSTSNRWKGALLKRNKTSVMPSNGGFDSFGSKEERLLLTNGTPLRFDSFSNPMACDYYSFKEEKKICDNNNGEEGKWVSMFQNLKPT